MPACLPYPACLPACRDMLDEQQQHPQQLELAAVAVGCFLLLLRHAHAQRPGWPLRQGRETLPRLYAASNQLIRSSHPLGIPALLHRAIFFCQLDQRPLIALSPNCSLNQFVRLLAHHNLPLRLIRLLPRLVQAQQAAAAAAVEAAAGATGAAGPAVAARSGAGQVHHGQVHHARAPSVPQTESEMALLQNDELAAAAASLALSRNGGAEEDGAGGYSSGGGYGSGGGGYSSPERGGSGHSSPARTRWLGRTLPGSPSRRVMQAVGWCKTLSVGLGLSVAPNAPTSLFSLRTSFPP